MGESSKNIDWDKMSNRVIREKLDSLRHEHESLKQKMKSQIDYMKSLEIEYLKGNETLVKRQKGE